MTSQRRRPRPTPKRVVGRTGVRKGPPPPKSSFPISAVVAIAGAILIAAVLLIAKPFSGLGAPGASHVARGTNCPTSQPAALGASDVRRVTIATPKGSIVIKVQGSLSPIATGNFVALASCGFYDGVAFHRTAAMANGTPFVIQGGDPEGSGAGGPGYSIQDEPVTGTYKRGTVAMARTQQANSQGSQFFIVLDDQAGSVLGQANPGYAILGEVTSGMDVADAIFAASNGQELPTNPIPMTKVTVSNP